ncbi:NADH-quinone oxidoreductase subunit NuoG [Thalassotalea sp. ND16A]|uniref:NADH-quinone oxidoreductase subunit NuoG n=1 Tax=Thalassotalea sp. ND16A TaxID=1535422 RepID=UPI00051D361F|nr:NADH-quinone oxidoreductase subunit NuoG [Thalassotalea sp. ND16A]KGJ97170.1 NADH dehydrogenase (quinone) [Thalassotalea sp. ND16A]
MSDNAQTPKNINPDANPNLVTIHVDGSPYQVDASDNLLAGVLSSKLNLPYFCWHPSMGSVGACRQCAVTVFNDETQQQGRLAMACMTPVTDGMYIGLGDNYSSHFREQVISAMMTNHPHDCPVCAEGGECHLQDMTVMTGHNRRDYAGDKRTFSNQDLGPHIGHEMNRCITCYRCVRYYKDYAGGTDFGVYGSRNKVCFGRQQDGVLASEFSGNLVEVCPTGVFTDKPFSAHFSRKWDLQSAPSICKGCAVGCNISVGERYGSVRRVVNRYNDEVNGYFLCDRGRFGFGYVNANDRITESFGIKTQSSAPNQSICSQDVQISLAKYKGQRFVAIGSERASLETNAALKHLFGSDNFCSGLTAKQSQMLALNKQLLQQQRMLSIKQIEQADCVLILGEDVTQTSPRIALALRQSVRNAGLAIAKQLKIPTWQDEAVRTAAGKTLSPLFICDVSATKLDDVATGINYSSPDEIVRITQSIQQGLLSDNIAAATSATQPQLNAEQLRFVAQVCSALKVAKQPLIVSGHSLQCVELLQQIVNLSKGLSRKNLGENLGESLGENLNESSEHENQLNINLAILPAKANSLGLASLLDSQSLTLEQVCQLASRAESQQLGEELGEQGDNRQPGASSKESFKKIDGLVIAENELANLSLVQRENLFANVQTVIAIEHNQTAVSKRADVILPAASFSESQGLVVNYQGKAQCFYPAFTPKLPILPAWRMLIMVDAILGQGLLQAKLDKLQRGNDRSSQIQNLEQKQRSGTANSNDFWRVLQSIEPQFPDTSVFIAEQFLLKTARQTHRASGRTAMMANQTVHESKATIDNNSPYKFSMEGAAISNNSAASSLGGSSAMPFTWAPGWNSNQSVSKYQQQVGAELTNKSPVVQIFDPAAPNTINQGVDTADKKQMGTEHDTNNVNDSLIGDPGLTFVAAAHIYGNDYLGLKGSQFKLLSPIPFLSLHPQNAAALQLSECSHICLTVQQQLYVCQFNTSNRQADNCAIVHLAESPAQQFDLESLSAASISPASNEQIQQFKQGLSEQLQQAELDQQQLLERLQQNDQLIPIRLVAGGLDDL